MQCYLFSRVFTRCASSSSYTPSAMDFVWVVGVDPLSDSIDCKVNSAWTIFWGLGDMMELSFRFCPRFSFSTPFRIILYTVMRVSQFVRYLSMSQDGDPHVIQIFESKIQKNFSCRIQSPTYLHWNCKDYKTPETWFFPNTSIYWFNWRVVNHLPTSWHVHVGIDSSGRASFSNQ